MNKASYSRIVLPSLLTAGLAGTLLLYNRPEEPRNPPKQSQAEVSANNSIPKPYAIEKKQAPDFEYTTLEGQKISLKDSKNKLVVLEFWSTGCKPCLELIPQNNAIYEKYGKRDDFLFVAVNGDYADDVADKEKAKVAMTDYLRRFSKENGMAYPIANDLKWGSGIIEKFDGSGIPLTVIIKDKMIEHVMVGKKENGLLEQRIEALLNK